GAGVPCWITNSLLQRNPLARRIDDAQEELPVRLRVRSGGLADLDQHRILPFLQLNREAMPIVADAVAPFLEAERLDAVDPDDEVVVRRAAHLGGHRLGYAKLRIRKCDRVVGV